MPKRSRKPAAKDFNQLARSIVDQATGNAPKPVLQPPVAKAAKVTRRDKKDPAAVALGRKGGLKGGKARAAKMTKEERSASAKKAAAARWQKRANG